nr:hypothetical protein K70PH128C1_LOCUS2 [Klebsiella phage vB_Ko_K70PH128C1]
MKLPATIRFTSAVSYDDRLASGCFDSGLSPIEVARVVREEISGFSESHHLRIRVGTLACLTSLACNQSQTITGQENSIKNLVADRDSYSSILRGFRNQIADKLSLAMNDTCRMTQQGILSSIDKRLTSEKEDRELDQKQLNQRAQQIIDLERENANLRAALEKHGEATSAMADALGVDRGVNLIAIVNALRDNLAASLEVDGKGWNELIGIAGADHGDAVNYQRVCRVAGSNGLTAVQFMAEALQKIRATVGAGCTEQAIEKIEKMRKIIDDYRMKEQIQKQVSAMTGGHAPITSLKGDSPSWVLNQEGKMTISSAVISGPITASKTKIAGDLKGAIDEAVSAGIKAAIADALKDLDLTTKALSIAVDVLNTRIMQVESNVKTLDARTSK